MNKQTNINIRTDVDVKNKAEHIFEELGLNMSTAINIFLRQAIRKGGLPFDVILEVPNEDTVKAINEARNIIKDSNSKGFNNIDELKKALEL